MARHRGRRRIDKYGGVGAGKFNQSQRGKATSVGIPFGCPVQRFRHLLGLSYDFPHASMPLVHESLFDCARENLEERIEKSPRVDQQNGIQIEPEPLQRNRLEQLFQGPAAARQGNGGLATSQHDVFADTHILDELQLGQARMPPLEVSHELRQTANNPAALAQGSVRKRPH